LEVGDEPLHNGPTPALDTLPLGDQPADVPIQADQLLVDRTQGTLLGRADAILDLHEHARVVGGERKIRAHPTSSSKLAAIVTASPTASWFGLASSTWISCGRAATRCTSTLLVQPYFRVIRR